MGGRVDFTLCSQCQALGQALILCRQGEGILSVGMSCCHLTLHLWIADQVRNDGTMLRIVFTLTFDSSPFKGEGAGGCVVIMFGHGQVMVL